MGGSGVRLCVCVLRICFLHSRDVFGCLWLCMHVRLSMAEHQQPNVNSRWPACRVKRS